MNGLDVKKVMKQVHISTEMQEEIIMNLQNQMENGKKRTWNWRKKAAAATAFVLIAGVVSFPVQAVLKSVVQARMEDIPAEELQDMADMIQEQEAQADGFSREYSDTEKERAKELWQAYENGTFPEKTIQQVESTEEVVEGTLCYVKSTSDFYLPDREMTDEELLEIIDYENQMDYVIRQNNGITEEEKAAYHAEALRIQKMVQDANGISGKEAIEIAEKQLKSDLGEKAEELELMTDRFGNGAELIDISEEEFESELNVAYDVGFGNPDDHFTYGYVIDAVTGKILHTWNGQ